MECCHPKVAFHSGWVQLVAVEILQYGRPEHSRAGALDGEHLRAEYMVSKWCRDRRIEVLSAGFDSAHLTEETLSRLVDPREDNRYTALETHADSHQKV